MGLAVRHVIVLGAALVLAPGVGRESWAQEPRQSTGAAAVDEAIRLNREFIRLAGQGRYDDAEPVGLRALAMLEKTFGPNDKVVALALDNLATLYMHKGDLGRAAKLCERALAILERGLGPGDVHVADALSIKASLHKEIGDYATAESLYLRALTIQEKAHGEAHPAVAEVENSLGLLYLAKGDSPHAEILLQRALEVRERTLGAKHPDVASSLGNLAGVYVQRADYVRAADLLKRALLIQEQTLGPNHPDLANTLNNLGGVYLARDDYAHAAPYFVRALAIWEQMLGPRHPLLVNALSNLATAYRFLGDDKRPEPLFLRALSIGEDAIAPSQSQATLLANLASLYLAKGDVAQAVAVEGRALAAREQYVARALTTGSEQQRRLFLAGGRSDMDAAVSLHAQGAPNNPTARALALLAIEQSKGRVLDAMTDTQEALRAHLAPEDVKRMDQLRSVRAEIARRDLSGPGPGTSFDEHKKQLYVLREQVDGLEGALAAHSAELRASETPITTDEIARRIPADTALVEITVYKPYNVRGRTHAECWAAPRRYAAYSLRSNGAIGYADLGEATAIDDLVARLRPALSDPQSNWKPLARELDKRVGSLVRGLMADATHLLFVPDGSLNLVPLGVALDEEGRTLLTRSLITYLTTGRDLVHLGARRDATTSPPLVVANPDFGSGSTTPGPHDRAADLRRAVFAPLPGTEAEGHAVAALLPGVATLMGAEATVSAVSSVHAPRVLHVATHGFFLEDAARPPVELTRGLQLEVDGATRVENPLLRSGLVFSGANLHQAENSGIMTALEASSLDLWGTKLVVLSACETGIGDVMNGEGVYGLRRALVLAGSESQVMSLWKVDDAATRDLMVAYYSKLKAGGGRGDSLRKAQNAMASSTDRAHPYFWASFIPSGDWRPLPSDSALSSNATETVNRHGGACGCVIADRRSTGAGWWLLVFLGAAMRRIVPHGAARPDEVGP